MSGNKNPLQAQLDEQKFLHAIHYVSQSSRGIKKLTSSELAHLNQMITARQDDVWRLDPAEVQIPTGKKIQFNVMSNPISRARDIIGNAQQIIGNVASRQQGNVSAEIFEAASYLYSQLVLEHLFKDANRRTAVLATLWLLQESGVDIDADQLHQVPIGDLRDPKNLSQLAHRIQALTGP